MNITKEELIESIKTTNNGYLFVPTKDEIVTASEYPEVFTIIINPTSEFSQKIYLK